MSLINHGNVDDIRSSIKCCDYTVEYLQAEITKELNGQNRSTVIKLISAAIKRKMRSNASTGNINHKNG